MNLFLIWSWAVMCWGSSKDKEKLAQDYIQQYQELAILEMKRTGIPASIKLAQAILESNAGTSHFALASNNHFGIKCKQYWKGKTYQHKDDDLDEHGNLRSSCFRAYSTVIDSYIDHSNFLVESPSYFPLFRSKNISYKYWAYGLQP